MGCGVYLNLGSKVMSNCKLNWREGKLFELSPFGTGFIEEESTGLAFGFHISMVGTTGRSLPNELEGQCVRFTVTEDGKVEEVEFTTSSESRKSPGRETASQSPEGKKKPRGL
jgi:hypothetical protein